MSRKYTFWCSCSIHILMVILFLFTHSTKAQIAKGADVGWLSYFENTLGITYLNDTNQEQDALQILKDHDINAIRLRAFVNPTEANFGEVSTQDVVKNAVRANNLGLDVMITIHYSDVWADPGSQHKPASWENLSFQDLSKAVYDYTFELIDALLTAGVTPKWVQVGNETDPGFLWEDARLSTNNNFANMTNFVALSNKGYDAIKDRSPTTKVITHLSAGNNTSFLTNFFDEFYAKGGKNDIIGVSYYPRWHGGSIQNVVNNLDILSYRFNKDVMICEIGNLETANKSTTYNMLVDAINLVEALPNNRGLGVFYWEPISHSSINGYEQGLALPIDDKKYQFSWVLDAFLNDAENCTPTTITPYIKINDENWQQKATIVGRVGDTITFNPHPENGSNWSWIGPNGFSANTRKIELSAIQKNQSGDYTVTCFPEKGCPALQTFSLKVYEIGEVIIDNPGFETGQLAPWNGSGNFGIDTDLKNSGIYSGWFGGGNSELYQTIIDLLPNTTYNFSSYVRNWSSDNGVVTVGVRDFGNSIASTEIGITGNNGTNFELAEVSFTTGSNNTSAVIFASTTKSQTWGKLDDVKVIQTSALSLENYKKDEFEIYPNPTSENLIIKIKNTIDSLDLTIYNLQGKNVLSEHIKFNKKNTFNVSVATLKRGVYFIQLKNNLTTQTKRLIIH